MAAAIYDFEVEQGTTLLKPFVWKDSNGAAVNLAGYTARMQIRSSVSSPDVLLELSTANDRIQITPATGTITLVFTPAITSGVNWRRGKYDLELTDSDGRVTRLMQGEVSLSREVTRG